MCGELGNGTTSKVETHGRIKTEINNKSRVLGVASWGRDSWPRLAIGFGAGTGWLGLRQRSPLS